MRDSSVRGDRPCVLWKESMCSKVHTAQSSSGEAYGSEVAPSLPISTQSYWYKTCERNPDFAKRLINNQWQFHNEIKQCSHSEEPKNMRMQKAQAACQTHITSYIMLHSLRALVFTSVSRPHLTFTNTKRVFVRQDPMWIKQGINRISVASVWAGGTLGMLSHLASDFTSACSTSQLRELEIVTEKTEKERSETVQQVIADSAMCFSLGF